MYSGWHLDGPWGNTECFKIILTKLNGVFYITKSRKNVHIIMCLETFPLWVWSSACVQLTFSPHLSGDLPWALSCHHHICCHCIAQYVQLSQSPWSLFSQSNMNRYTFAELSDMHLIYSEVQGNGCEAQRIYQECYPQWQLPHHTTFASIDRWLQ
jgi:hypothetical protein